MRAQQEQEMRPLSHDALLVHRAPLLTTSSRIHTPCFSVKLRPQQTTALVSFPANNMFLFTLHRQAAPFTRCPKGYEGEQ